MNRPSVRALPLWQPWASLVAYGAKRVETRGYSPQRLGLRFGQRIAIHACKTDRDLWLCEDEEFSMHIPFGFPPWDELPLGAVVATCVLDRAREITAESAACLEERNPEEFAFGHYAPGRWAWVLRDIERLPVPVPFKGSQGTFDVPVDLLVGSSAAVDVDLGDAPSSPAPSIALPPRQLSMPFPSKGS